MSFLCLLLERNYPTRKASGSLTTNNHESYEVLNETFQKVFKEETDDPPEDIEQYAGMELQV